MRAKQTDSRDHPGLPRDCLQWIFWKSGWRYAARSQVAMWRGVGEVYSRKREKGVDSSVRADAEILEWRLREIGKVRVIYQKWCEITNRYGAAWRAVCGIHHCVHPWVDLPEMEVTMDLTLRMEA
jgi:hypothetical protein